MEVLSASDYIIITVVGVLVGIVNTLAGSGSLVTLPVFILICGLSPTVANGTNRIGVLIQMAVAAYTFKQSGKTDFKGLKWMLIPALPGVITGTIVAVNARDEMMNQVIGILLIIMLFVILINPKRWINPGPSKINPKHPLSLLTFLAIGFYIGFIQAGAGIMLLAMLVLVSGHDLLKANTLKVAMVLIVSVPALAIFIMNDQVHWGFGLLMAGAQAIGAWLGGVFATRYEHANIWTHRLLVVVVFISALKFLGIMA